MELTSVAMLYVILPVSLAAYILAPGRVRPGVLLAASLAYYALVAWRAVPIMLISLLLDFLALRVMERLDGSALLRRLVCRASVAKNLGLILYTILPIRSIQSTEVIIGAVVFCLSGIDCVLGAYRREFPCERNILRFGLYCFFFPRLAAGPLMRYDTFAARLRDAAPEPRMLLDGLYGYLIGAVKVLFFGNYLFNTYQILRQYGAGDVSVLSGWCMALALALAVYYQYSGMCDMARGIGCLFGLHLPNNFYYPYQSSSVKEFHERFNTTYFDFLQRTVWGGPQKKRGLAADILGTLAVGLLFGLWFSVGVNKLLWGVFLAALLLLERYLLKGLLERIPRLLARAYTFSAVIVSFVIFAGESLLQSLGYFCNLFALGNVPLFNNRILYLLSNNWLVLLAGCFFATSGMSLLNNALRKAAPRVSAGVTVAVSAALLFISTTLMV